MARGDARDVPVSAVTLALGEQTLQLLLYPGIPLAELQQCVAAGFPRLKGDDVAAIKRADTDVFYPFSLLSRSPDLFETGVYDLVLDGDRGHASNASVRAASAASRKNKSSHPNRHRRHHRSNHAHRGHIKPADETEAGPASTDEDEDDALAYRGGSEEDEEEKEDEEEEFLREIDLTDFELPMLANVFTQACPTGSLDRASFERSLEKILSQVSKHWGGACLPFSR